MCTFCNQAETRRKSEKRVTSPIFSIAVILMRNNGEELRGDGGETTASA